MKIYLIAALIIFFASAAAAQDLGAYEEVTAGNFFGIGARQMSMGGTGIASSWDGAALYYNPAALARINRIEFQLGLTHQKFSNETTQRPNRYDGFTSTRNTASADMTKTRLGTLNLALPAPTYRGSLVLAFGINRIASFDRTALFNVIDDSLGYRIEDYGKEFETGGIYLYSAAAGVDISPRLSLGLAAHIYSGGDEFVYDYYFVDEPLDESGAFTNRIEESYIGISLKGGLLARPNANLNIGLTIESPLDYQVEYTFADEYDGYYIEYDLSRPFIFGAGLAYRFSTFTLAADAEYADWSQLSYNDNPDMEIDNDTLAMVYRDVLNLRIGGEYQIPSAGVALRAGYFSNPLPYQNQKIAPDLHGLQLQSGLPIGKALGMDDGDRNGYTLGFGWLIDKVLMLETAYVHGSFGRRFTAPNAEFISEGADGTAIADDSFSRVYVTMSYRY